MPQRYDDDYEDDQPRSRRPRRSWREDADGRDDYDDGYTGRVKDHRGPMILIFGILGLVTCQIFAILAFFMGRSDLNEIRAGRMDREGESMTNVGYILGMVGCILLMITSVLLIAYFILLAVVLGAK